MRELQGTLLGSGDPAVRAGAAIERLRLDGHSWVDVARDWLAGADDLLAALVRRVDWRQGRRWMYERMVDDPRLSRWYRAEDPPPHVVLADARAALTERYGVPFGGVACNFYRDGSDSVAFHRDRELRRLDDTRVAIVSLGARRPFLVRRRGGGPSRDLAPGAGDLVVMGGACQRDWEHGVPKVTSAGPRVSLSWRWSARGVTPAPGRRAPPPMVPAPPTPR